MLSGKVTSKVKNKLKKKHMKEFTSVHAYLIRYTKFQNNEDFLWQELLGLFYCHIHRYNTLQYSCLLKLFFYNMCKTQATLDSFY